MPLKDKAVSSIIHTVHTVVRAVVAVVTCVKDLFVQTVAVSAWAEI